MQTNMQHTPPRTLSTAWTVQAQRSADRTALIFQGKHWSYGELHRASGDAARRLAARELERGDRVILMMDNGPAFLATFLGCQLLGLVPVPVSPKSSVARVRYLVEDSEAALLVIEPSLSERVRAGHEVQPYGRRILMLQPQPDAMPVEFASLDAGDCALIQYTSGSSADSKGVMINHRAALENIRGFSAEMALAPGDVFSSLLPLFHDMGLMCFGLAPLLLGYPLVLYRAESLSLTAWLAGIARHGVTITGAPDSLLQIANRVVDDPAAYPLQSLRMLICGSEPVRRSSIEAFGSRFGVFDAIKPAYGMAELTLCASITPANAPPRIDAQGRVASGRAIQGVELRIGTEHGGVADEPGVCGEILVRSPAVMSGYWESPVSTAAAFHPFGYLRTGDLGYLDSDGYLYVIGRLKNMIIRGGEKFSPHDLEAASQDLSAIRRAAVIQSQRAEARIIAVLEVDRRLLHDSEVLARLSRQYRSAAFARAGIAPDSCWFVCGGQIPCTENGKMRHATLRAEIDAGRFVAAWSDTSQEERHVAAVA